VKTQDRETGVHCCKPLPCQTGPAVGTTSDSDVAVSVHEVIEQEHCMEHFPYSLRVQRGDRSVQSWKTEAVQAPRIDDENVVVSIEAYSLWTLK
jgi:hypothetical protein